MVILKEVERSIRFIKEWIRNAREFGLSDKEIVEAILNDFKVE